VVRTIMDLAIFDGHNDTLLRLVRKGLPPEALLTRSEQGHIDLPRARDGGFAGGLFAAFTPSVNDRVADGAAPPLGREHPPAPAVDQATALRLTVAMLARLRRLARRPEARLAVCRSVAEIRRAMAERTIAAVFHIEGAEAIDPDLDVLEALHAAGLRSLGLVWSRPNAFGHGVPFRFPSPPDTGPGLTDAGKALVEACGELRILVDLSHLNERGFWDVAEISGAPLVASHSNAHVLSASSRNLTDAQLDAIRASGGLVGLNLAVGFLRADGADRPDTPLEVAVRHVDHLVGRLGIEGVAIGSDFDGCTVPRAIGDVAGLPRLLEALAAAGYDRDALTKIAHGNWLRVLERTWGG
jgi:membrane dipeptidase